MHSLYVYWMVISGLSILYWALIMSDCPNFRLFCWDIIPLACSDAELKG